MAHDIRIVKVFREEGVCGATDLENRPALMALLEALVANGTKLVLIEKLELRNLSEINRIYWSEMLFRVRWAAGLNLRHQRWQAGCVDAADSPANFRLLSRICGLTLAPAVSPSCDKGRFPWPCTCESRRIVWSPLGFCC